MNSPLLKKALKTEEAKEPMIRGLLHRFEEYKHREFDAEVLLHMKQLDWLVEQIQNEREIVING